MWTCPKCGLSQRSDTRICQQCFVVREGDPTSFVLTEEELREEADRLLSRGLTVYISGVLLTVVPFAVFSATHFEAGDEPARWATLILCSLAVCSLLGALLLHLRKRVGRFLTWPIIGLWFLGVPIGTTLAVIVWMNLEHNSVRAVLKKNADPAAKDNGRAAPGRV